MITGRRYFSSRAFTRSTTLLVGLSSKLRGSTKVKGPSTRLSSNTNFVRLGSAIFNRFLIVLELARSSPIDSESTLVLYYVLGESTTSSKDRTSVEGVLYYSLTLSEDRSLAWGLFRFPIFKPLLCYSGAVVTYIGVCRIEESSAFLLEANLAPEDRLDILESLLRI